MRTSIVILTYNKLDYTKECIGSIRKYTKPGTYELIVVDNNSTDGTVKWLKQQKDIRTILNNENMGFPKGCNQGMAQAGGDNILLLNNDVIVTHEWLNNLAKALYSSADIGAVGAVTNNCSYGQAIAVNYKSLEEMHQFARRHNISNPANWDERLKLVGFCLLIRREVVAKIGLLDEMFSPGNYEDDDYSVRMRRAGYKLVLCRDTFIHHFGSASFGDRWDEYLKLLEINRQKFAGKWGYDPNYSMIVRQEIINLIDAPTNARVRVLEVGCACGGTLLQIKNQYRGASVYGIELNAGAAADASLFAETIAADIEAVELPYPQRFFHCIILADVLEHLQNPWAALRRLYQHLAPGGQILASIPNVMHFSVIRNLLNGHWTYENAGILDNTHMRFFTLNEIHKLFAGAGFTDFEYGAVQLNCSDADKQFVEAVATLTGGMAKDQYLAYQYLVKADKGFTADDLAGVLADIAQEINIGENVKYLNHYPLEQVLARIKTSVPAAAAMLNLIAITNFSAKAYEYVIPYLQLALEMKPADADTLYNLGFVLFAMGEYDLALSYISKIATKNEKDLQLLAKIDKAILDGKLDPADYRRA